MRCPHCKGTGIAPIKLKQECIGCQKTIVRMLLAKLPPLAGSVEGRFNQLIADLETWPEEDLELMRSTPEAKRLAAILTALAGQEDG